MSYEWIADTLATADADPLGVDMNVTFDNVGGLDGRKSSIITVPSSKAHTYHADSLLHRDM